MKKTIIAVLSFACISTAAIAQKSVSKISQKKVSSTVQEHPNQLHTDKAEKRTATPDARSSQINTAPERRTIKKATVNREVNAHDNAQATRKAK